MHGHLRLNEMLAFTAPVAARYNYYYTAMGNHKGWPTSTPECALEYKEMIRQQAPDLQVNVPCFIQENADPEMIRHGYESGAWIASKFYPRGVTTNSDDGVRPFQMHTLYPAYEMHAELGMLALFHGMSPHDPLGRDVHLFDQEKRFIERIGELLARVPRLKVVYEHITTREAASFVKWCQKNGYQVEATVAPQYLLHSTNWLFAGGMNPGNYSIPPLQSELDQEALIEFVTKGYGFRGNDSAPHDERAKMQYVGCAGGIYSDIEGLDLIAYFSVFETAKALDLYENFVALKGPYFYGLKPAPEELSMTIIEEEWTVSDYYSYSEGRVRSIFAGEKLNRKVLVS
jgi:dihydroorotase